MSNTSLWNGTGVPGQLPRSITARGLIYDAYRALGVLRSGMGASTDGLDDGLNALNDLVDSWNTERLTVPSIRRDVYQLTAGEASYDLGDQEEHGSRPLRVEGVSVIASGSTAERPIAVLTLEQFRLGVEGAYIDNAFPYSRLTLNPAPSASDELVVYSWQGLTGFADLDTSYQLPAGYARALKWALAVELAPAARIHAKIDAILYDQVRDNARLSKAAIKRLNVPRLDMRCDAALVGRGGFDVMRGEYR